MKCPNCNTENPENAKFCRTCGINLQENNTFEEKEEEIKHTSIIEDNTNYQQYDTDNGNSSGWRACCICLVVIFIVFAIFSIF